MFSLILNPLLCLMSPLPGGFEHVCYLSSLEVLRIDEFWSAFEDLPEKIHWDSLQEKLAILRERLDSIAEPLM